MKVRRFLTLGLLSVLLGACDSMPQMQLSAIPPVSPGKARLFVYRAPTIYDTTLWSEISLNGTPVGSSAPGNVFYRDVAPGTYRIEAWTERLYPDQAKTVAVAVGSTTFIKIQTVPAWGKSGRQWNGETFYVAIVDPAIGRFEMQNLRLTPG